MLPITNPTTGKIIARIREDTESSIQDKFKRSQEAQLEWAQTPWAERQAILMHFARILVRDQNELAKTLTLEMGKPIKQARSEISATAKRIEYFVREAPLVMVDQEVFSDGKTAEMITQEPLGVIANISAWNYPYFVGSNVYVPAMLTGNAVLYKASEFATLTAGALEDLSIEAGIPLGIFNIIIGGQDAGEHVLKQPINGMFFTGSYATGKKINQALASRMIRVQLELGGKDPAYAREDADPEKAARSLAEGAFYNAGQSCCAIERIYVHEKIYEPFVEHFLTAVKSWVVGDPMDENTDIGPLARKAQLRVLNAQVQDALKKGARLILGGNQSPKKPGFFFEPTVFTQVHSKMRLMREESFGPIIGIQKVRDDQEAIQLMNDTEYGLTASVYTQSEFRARIILQAINAGTVYWNCCDRVSPHLPWSGRKHSGIGSTLSHEGIRAFCQPKAWHLRKA